MQLLVMVILTDQGYSQQNISFKEAATASQTLKSQYRTDKAYNTETAETDESNVTIRIILIYLNKTCFPNVFVL